MNNDPISVTCPACWQTVELDVDPSVEHQVYIEDCTVCCRPMRVEVWVADGEARVDVSSGNE